MQGKSNAMSDEDDKAAILAVLKAETEAWLRRDIDDLASHWVHSPQARRMSSVAHQGSQVQIGWEAIRAALSHMAGQYPRSINEGRVRHEAMNIVVNGDSAWVTYDQIGEKGDDVFELAGTQHELKIFHRLDGRWKIACIVVMQRSIDHETNPTIEIEADRKVLWLNAQAHDQITDHPLLIISNGRLRARHRTFDADLQAAVNWANRNRHWSMPPSQTGRLVRAVVLGENANGAPAFCWVMLADGKILISFNDNQLVKRRVEIARAIYSLTAAQAELAQLLCEGNDLAASAANLGVTVNTVRTHLQRLFDKTGTRSQAALVAKLLSAEAPTA